MKPFVPALVLCLCATAAAAEPPLKPELGGLSFLLGRWSGGQGRVAETGGTSTGQSSFEPVANGAGLLRRDHTELRDAAGKPTGGFDQVMLVYPEGGTLHADYLDGAHVIHYTSAVVTPGSSAVFTSAGGAGAPVFRLAYTLEAPGRLGVAFSMAPPGGAAFKAIATGTLTRAP